MGEAFVDRGRVFADPMGEWINPQNLTSAWKRLSRRIGVDLRLHDLRHYAASLMIAAGMDLFAVSRLMGHSSTSVTGDIYGHLFPGAEDRMAEVMEKAWEEID